jgi:hypothetical protein
MRTPVQTRLITVVIVFALSGCASAPRGEAKPMAGAAASNLASQGATRFGIQWEGRLVGASERGVMAVTDGVTTFTTRPASRVFVIHNRKEFPPSELQAFKGSDDELKAIGMKLLQASEARPQEAADVRVLQQFTQTAETLPGGQAPRVMPAQRSHRTVMINRRIQGIDVVSSRLVLNVDVRGRPAFMELAWPDLAPEVLERATRYKALVDGGFTAPRMEGADVESVAPVILHSPAIGFYDDVTAAIRVIYRPLATQVGQKAVRYVDERGADVALPRDVDRVREQAVKRSDVKK